MTAGPLDSAQDALISVQSQLIAAMLAAQNATLAGRMVEREERLARLERAASRNSGNSRCRRRWMTSPDGPRRASRSAAGGAGGTQESSRARLAWSQHPDRTVPHFPRGACPCGADLADAADLGVAASHQQIDILEMAAAVIQHDLHTVACPWGRVHQAGGPAGAGTVLRDRPAGLVHVPDGRARDPVHRCAELIEALTGAKPSPGFVHATLVRAGRRGQARQPADPGADHHRRDHLRR